MGSCANPHWGQNDGTAYDGFGNVPHSLSGIRDQLAGVMQGLMSTTSQVLRISANAYVLLVFLLFAMFVGHLFVRYLRRIYAAVGSLFRTPTPTDLPVEPTVLMVWEILMFLLSVVTSVILSLLWPIWLPFILIIWGCNTASWSLSNIFTVSLESVRWLYGSRGCSLTFWKAQYHNVVRTFSKSPYSYVDSDDEDEDKDEDGDGGYKGEERNGKAPALHSSATCNSFVQLHDECQRAGEEAIAEMERSSDT